MEKILQRFNTLKAERSNWNNSWQRIAELVNTKKANFTSSQTEGEFYNTKVFDTTAQTCVKNRASTIKSMLFGNYDFKLEPVKKYIDNDNIVKFFDEATSILKDNLRNPNSSFNKALSQAGEKKCPVCGSTHICEISRITGYLSFDERFCESKVKERSSRIDHNNLHEENYTKPLQ